MKAQILLLLIILTASCESSTPHSGDNPSTSLITDSVANPWPQNDVNQPDPKMMVPDILYVRVEHPQIIRFENRKIDFSLNSNDLTTDRALEEYLLECYHKSHRLPRTLILSYESPELQTLYNTGLSSAIRDGLLAVMVRLPQQSDLPTRYPILFQKQFDIADSE